MNGKVEITKKNHKNRENTKISSVHKADELKINL